MLNELMHIAVSLEFSCHNSAETEIAAAIHNPETYPDFFLQCYAGVSVFQVVSEIDAGPILTQVGVVTLCCRCYFIIPLSRDSKD